MTYDAAQPVSGTVKAILTDGTLEVPVLDTAPGSDTGQHAIPVRVISQLGAGTGGGGSATDVAIHDNTTPAQHLAVDAAGKIGVNNLPAALTDAQLRASPVPVSGFPATQDVSDRAARLVGKVQQTDGSLDLSLLGAAPASDTGQVAVPVRVISQLGAGGGGAASSVTVNDPTTPAQKLAVDAAGKIGINNFPATQPVSGPLTDAQLRASAVPVSGTFYQGTQPVSAAALPLPAGASTEATLALIKAKTDNLDVALSTRAGSSVALNDGVTPETKATVRAGSSLPVAGDSALIVALRDKIAEKVESTTGTLASAVDPPITLPLDSAAATCIMDIRGTFTGIIQLAMSTNGVDFDVIYMLQVPPSTVLLAAAQTVGQFLASCAGASHVRAQVFSWTSGSATITLRASPAAARAFLANTGLIGFGTNSNGNLAIKVASVLPLPVDPAVVVTTRDPVSTKASQAVTFTSIFRLAARPYALSKAFTANTRVQFAVIYHAVTATKLVKVKRVEIALESSSVAAIIMADLVRLTGVTAPATGNPAITQSPQFPGDAVSGETVCLALPTTAGSEGAVHSFLEWNLGITGAASVLNPPPALNWYTLWPQVQGAGEVPENKYPTMRAGTAEGFAVTLDSNAASTVKGYVVIEFSEE